MPLRLFRRSRVGEDAARLLEAVMAASRRPALFGPGGVPDTLDGRFEAMALNASLALVRLKQNPESGSLAQVFADELFSHFDAGLREAGVGDLTVPKRMRALAGAFYGRLEAYERTLAEGGLEESLERNIGVSPAFAARLAAHVCETVRQQSSARAEELLNVAGWPEFAG